MTRLAAFAVLMFFGLIATAAAETPEERQACQNDAFRLCQQFIPDRARVFACLVQYRGSLSQLCHSAIVASLPPEPAAPSAKKKFKKKTTKTTKKKKTKTARKTGPLDLSAPSR